MSSHPHFKKEKNRNHKNEKNRKSVKTGKSKHKREATIRQESASKKK